MVHLHSISPHVGVAWILNTGLRSNITGELPEGAYESRCTLKPFAQQDIKKPLRPFWCTFRDSNPGPTD